VHRHRVRQVASGRRWPLPNHGDPVNLTPLRSPLKSPCSPTSVTKTRIKVRATLLIRGFHRMVTLKLSLTPIRPGLAGFDQRRADSLVHYPFEKRATRIPDRRRSADALVHRARSRAENGATACVAGWAPPQRPIKLAVSFSIRSC